MGGEHHAVLARRPGGAVETGEHALTPGSTVASDFTYSEADTAGMCMSPSYGQDAGLRGLGELVRSAPACVAAVTVPDMDVVFANEAFRALFPASALDDVALADEPGEIGDSWRPVVDLIREVARTGEPRVSAETPVLVRDPAGSPKAAYLAVTCTPVAAGTELGDVLIMAIETTSTVETRRAMETGQERLAASERQHRAFSLTLQRGLLPPRRPLGDDLETAVRYRAGIHGAEVGGDWYDVLNLGAGRVAVVVGDVMGRGMGAAALMGQLRAAVRSLQHLDLPPAEVLGLLDRLVSDLQAGVPFEENKIVTCVYAVYDPHDQTLVYSSAGHLPPVLLHPEGGTSLLRSDETPPLGVGDGRWTERLARVLPGSVLVLYTDGLVEDRNRDIDRGVADLATTLRHAGDLELMADRVLDELRPPAGYEDDVALLLVRIPEAAVASPARRTSLALPSLPHAVGHARRHARRVLDRWKTPAEVADRAVLVLDELVTNAITHGAPPVRLSIRQNDARLVIQVSDGSLHLPRQSWPDHDYEHGRGLRLVSALSDRWGDRSRPLGKLVWAELVLPTSFAREPASWTSSTSS